MTNKAKLSPVPESDNDPIFRILDPFDTKLTKLLCNTARELIDFYETDVENRADAADGLDQITAIMKVRRGGS